MEFILLLMFLGFVMSEMDENRKYTRRVYNFRTGKYIEVRYRKGERYACYPDELDVLIG